MEATTAHCTEGIGIWDWASNDQGAEPDVLACCGDTPTLEILGAVSILREHLPELKIRVVNVVDLMKLQSASEHRHGLSDTDYDSLFTRDTDIVFAFHGYPWLIRPTRQSRIAARQPKPPVPPKLVGCPCTKLTPVERPARAVNPQNPGRPRPELDDLRLILLPCQPGRVAI